MRTPLPPNTRENNTHSPLVLSLPRASATAQNCWIVCPRLLVMPLQVSEQSDRLAESLAWISARRCYLAFVRQSPNLAFPTLNSENPTQNACRLRMERSTLQSSTASSISTQRETRSSASFCVEGGRRTVGTVCLPVADRLVGVGDQRDLARKVGRPSRGFGRSAALRQGGSGSNSREGVRLLLVPAPIRRCSRWRRGQM